MKRVPLRKNCWRQNEKPTNKQIGRAGGSIFAAFGAAFNGLGKGRFQAGAKTAGKHGRGKTQLACRGQICYKYHLYLLS